MSSIENVPPQVAWTLRLEELDALDGAVAAVAPVVGAAFATGWRGRLLRGEWLGHALHPLLTDVVIGSWTSASVLDVVGGEEGRGAARTLVGVGLAAVGPTAWSGWAEWSDSGPREQRVGLVHAVTNGAAIGLYAASWLARRRGRHAAGAGLGLAGASAMGVAAYLGGHLSTARDVGSRHPAFEAVDG
ncbi:DUF2231 domain-containing protein [Phycicoccus sonneratiae]|uniref:(2Fe-2S)-binding protein n=1 Tax=Phycicoccus sonneratiae TaxID=2807628 RepID=A0ABS2CMG5_9MICO|nr:DUF2231 domain-containing protein [Phycicoccus sonneraticus]MBM6401076.1 (2Fe-2S)-binding protein [Phycicoccus sonneraticus]